MLSEKNHNNKILLLEYKKLFRPLITTTVVYRCSKVINRLGENKSWLQTKTKGNTSTIRGKHETTEALKYSKQQTKMVV